MLKLTHAYFLLASNVLINMVLHVKFSQVDLQQVNLKFLNLRNYRQKDRIKVPVKVNLTLHRKQLSTFRTWNIIKWHYRKSFLELLIGHLKLFYNLYGTGAHFLYPHYFGYC
jgi:hypothetical protein